MNIPDSPAPWALSLANNISTDHWNALKNPGKFTSEERINAARIIQALVEVGAREVNKPRNAKRGPKPRGKSNQTDDDIASLWSCIRMILELPSKTSLPSISTKAGSVLQHSRAFIENHLLLTTEEARIVQFHLMSWSRATPDISEECKNLPKPIKELNPPVSLESWAGSESPQEKVGGSRPKRSKRTQHLDATFVSLVRLMELHKAPLLHDKRVTIFTDDRDEEWRHLEFHEFNSPQELGLKKKDILWTVIGRLFHLKTILHQASFAWSPNDAEHLIFELENANRPLGQSLKKSGIDPSLKKTEINPVIANLSTLKRIIVSSSDRQGIGPFSSFLPSFIYKSFPLPALPGQIVAG